MSLTILLLCLWVSELVLVLVGSRGHLSWWEWDWVKVLFIPSETEWFSFLHGTMGLCVAVYCCCGEWGVGHVLHTNEASSSHSPHHTPPLLISHMGLGGGELVMACNSFTTDAINHSGQFTPENRIKYYKLLHSLRLSDYYVVWDIWVVLSQRISFNPWIL